MKVSNIYFAGFTLIALGLGSQVSGNPLSIYFIVAGVILLLLGAAL